MREGEFEKGVFLRGTKASCLLSAARSAISPLPTGKSHSGSRCSRAETAPPDPTAKRGPPALAAGLSWGPAPGKPHGIPLFSRAGRLLGKRRFLTLCSLFPTLTFPPHPHGSALLLWHESGKNITKNKENKKPVRHRGKAHLFHCMADAQKAPAFASSSMPAFAILHALLKHGFTHCERKRLSKRQAESSFFIYLFF